MERSFNTREVVRVDGMSVLTPGIKSIDSSTDWRETVALFIASEDVCQSSRNLYTKTISQFFHWVEDTNRDINSLTNIDIQSFKDSLFERGLSSLTVSSYIVVVRKFYSWAESNMIYPNIAKGIKTPRRKQSFKKQHLSTEKSVELLEFSKSSSLRDYAIVNLLLRTGLRTIEVMRANVGDIVYKGDKRALLVWGKGHTEKDDYVLLTGKAWEPIKAYLDTRKGAKTGEPLFVSESHQNKGGRLTTKTISSLCKAGLRTIGLDGREYTAHSLRHTTAVNILKQGGDIFEVQTVLRHSSPTTSQIYTESIKEEMRLKNPPESRLDNAF